MSAKISWMIYEDEAFMPYNTYMADGAYTAGDIILRRIQIWNNYRGTDAVDDVIDANLILSFKQYEDNFLLNLIEIRLPGDSEYTKPKIDTDRAVFELGTLYGDAGGTYKEIEIKIGPIPENMKSELKSLVFYLDY